MTKGFHYGGALQKCKLYIVDIFLGILKNSFVKQRKTLTELSSILKLLKMLYAKWYISFELFSQNIRGEDKKRLDFSNETNQEKKISILKQQQQQNPPINRHTDEIFSEMPKLGKFLPPSKCGRDFCFSCSQPVV